MFCSKCGYELSDNDAYCQKCGNKVPVSKEKITQENTEGSNVQYVMMNQRSTNYSLWALICSIIILPIALIMRYGFAQTVVKYGWHAYTATELSAGMKVVAIVLVLTVLILSIVFMSINDKKNPLSRNKFLRFTIAIDIVATLLSFFIILG